ncbi:hypothetical protein V6C31_03745 [Caldibacillus debilis]|nr:hypothetical protein [Caldibacillus debilis]
MRADETGALGHYKHRQYCGNANYPRHFKGIERRIDGHWKQ